MKDKSQLFQSICSVLCVIFGNCLSALSLCLFIIPSNMITGGTTGISLFVEHLFHCNISLFVFLFNIIMLILGLFILGKKFALTTILSSFTFPIALEIFRQIIGDYVITSDPLLCSVFGGLCIGFSLGIVIRSGASTGGMDIPPLVLHRLFKIPVSVSLYVFDVAILLLQAVFTTWDQVLYGIIHVLIYTIVIDKMLLAGSSKIQVKVVSSKSEEIRQAILEQVDRGVTILYGQGGYLKNNTDIILSVISNRELPQIERLIHQIDPESFMIISKVTEVLGRGFSLKKDHK